jgi:alcohol dehydrogenase
MYSLYCRLYQHAYRGASYLLPWRKPELITGENSVEKLPSLIKRAGINSVLIVTDKGIASLGLMNGLLLQMEAERLTYTVYDKTIPNPTIGNIEEAFRIYQKNKCEAIIAFGGGSPMDCAKGVGARVARPDKTIPQMKGQLKVRKRIPTLFAIPTTAGTGSEATVAAVISNPETHEKYAVNDPVLIPHYAVLDPLLTVKLPPRITSTTGMDALTHAVEAYIGRSRTKETIQCSKEAVTLIFDHLYEAYSHGEISWQGPTCKELHTLPGLLLPVLMSAMFMPSPTHSAASTPSPTDWRTRSYCRMSLSTMEIQSTNNWLSSLTPQGYAMLAIQLNKKPLHSLKQSKN